MISVLIVDDESAGREGLMLMLSRHSQFQVVASARDGHEAVAAIREHQPDLVLLDIQMPELDGFGVIQAVGVTNMPLTIFITAYDAFALKAFEVCALDYILKPFAPERLKQALDRAQEQLETHRNRESQDLAGLLDQLEVARRQARFADRLMIQDQGCVSFVQLGDVTWIEASDYISLLHLNDRVITCRESLKALEQKLDPAQFARVHKSAIVNVGHIQVMKPQFHGALEVVLTNGDRITVSRRRKKALLENPAFRYGM